MNGNNDSGHCASLSETYTLKTTITNHNGLHARPAAFISDTASKYKSRIYILTEDGRRASAASVLELLSLALKHGETVSIKAKGEDAREAAAKISEIIDADMGEKEKTAEENVQTDADGQPSEYGESIDGGQDAVSGQSMVFKGVSVYPRPVIGKAALLLHKKISYSEASFLTAGEEKDRLRSALRAVKEHFYKKAEAIYEKDRGNSGTADIYYAYSAMASDPVLIEHSMMAIDRGLSAHAAFAEAVGKIQSAMVRNGSSIFSRRASDYEALLRNVLDNLPSENGNAEEQIPVRRSFDPGTVIITDEALPGDIDLDDSNIAGIAMAFGSPESHFAVMAREAGIPLIVSAGERLLEIQEGSIAALNVSKGEILINPSSKKRIAAKIKKYNAAQDSEGMHRTKTAFTKDGIKITVSANAGSRSEAVRAASAGAEGIGLLRTEFLFLNSENPLDEDLQAAIHSEIASAQEGSSVAVRLIDSGNDKILKFMRLPDEKNPALGTRGIRAFDFNEEIFRAQIRAILRVIPEGRTRILLPMVSNIEEFKNFKGIISSEAEKMGIGKAHIGVMIEVPSAALMAGQFARYADFLSIGTNDLAQYSLAVDRNSSLYAGMADAFDPSVLRLIKIAIDGAAGHKREICVCGALASQPAAIPLLIGLGARKLSVALPEIPAVKRIIRICGIKECEYLASKALGMENAAETRAIAENYIKNAESAKIRDIVPENDSGKSRIIMSIAEILKKILHFFSVSDVKEKADNKGNV